MKRNDKSRGDPRPEPEFNSGAQPEKSEPISIDPARLMDAVDAVLIALEEYKIDTRGGTIAPTDLLGRPEQPKVLCDFTRWEIEQAAQFMTRMGLIEPASPGLT